MPSHLVAVLHSLPIGDGARTKSRIEIARDALGCRSHTIANLYPDRLKDVNGLGSEPMADAWMRGRRQILQAFEREDITDVLMGYGLQLPTGAQRAPFRSQVEWLHEEVAGRSVRVWTFGDRPAHPSRWQRVSHKYRPGSSIRDVARDLLTPYTSNGLLERQS